jgi:aldose 1-epimerase
MIPTMRKFAAWFCLLLLAHPASAQLARRPYGKTPRGETVELFTLTNQHGLQAAITNYGGIVVSLLVPDRHARLADVVLGFDSLDGYLAGHPYFGAIIGRYGNRIANARFTLDGITYSLAANNGPHHLHGGIRGFDKAVWNVVTASRNLLRLSHLSPDGDEGYPGALRVEVTYTLTPANELRIDYVATTDKPTVVNLTNHSYFNLAGQGRTDVLLHQVKFHADYFTPVGAGLIPTGELRPVRGTPFDFTTFRTIGERINAPDEQIRFGGGYDHNFVLRSRGGSLALAAEVYEPTSGRVMEVLTTEPGMQFYTGNFLDGSIRGKSGKPYGKRAAFCLETQHFPDSPNQPSFPSTVLRPGQQFQSTTVYRFSARR